MMTPEQTHVYIWLLCLDWNQNGFPFDVPTLARWCRVTPAIFRRAWSVVQDCFSSKEGRWFNERLEKEREKQTEYKKKMAENGKRGGRPQKASAFPGETKSFPEEKPPESIPFPSPIPTPVTTTVPSEPSPPPPTREKLAERVPDPYYPDFFDLLSRVPNAAAWEAEMLSALDGMHGPPVTIDQLCQAVRDYNANGKEPSLRLFRGYLRDAARPPEQRASGGQTRGQRLNPADRVSQTIASMTGRGAA